MSIDLEKAKKLIGAAGTLGSGTILKAIGKFVPGIGQFVSGAYTAGYAADQILDFVKDRLETPAARRNRQQLESRASQGVARADEEAELSQQEQQRSPLNDLLGLGKLGAQAAGGIASARAGADQQANEQALQQQQIQQQQAAQNQNLQLEQQKLAQQDQLATIKRQQEDLKRKEDLGFKQRAEERAIEKHKIALNKPNVKEALNRPLTKNQKSLLELMYEEANKF